MVIFALFCIATLPVAAFVYAIHLMGPRKHPIKKMKAIMNEPMDQKAEGFMFGFMAGAFITMIIWAIIL